MNREAHDVDAFFNSRVPTVCELARLGPDKAARFVDDLSDAIAVAMVDADKVTTQRLKAQMDALANAHRLYFREQPKHVQDAEIARLLDDAQRIELDVFAAPFEGGKT